MTQIHKYKEFVRKGFCHFTDVIYSSRDTLLLLILLLDSKGFCKLCGGKGFQGREGLW